MNRWVHVVKTLLAWVVVYSGLLHLVQRLKRPRILVLAYHRVTPDAELRGCPYPAMHVSTASFAAQIGALKRLYRIVPMSTLHAILQGREKLRHHVAVVTFDDGYRDNYQNAMPILVAHEVPATFFLSSGFVRGGQAFWFDRLVGVVRAWDHEPEMRAELRGILPPALVQALDDWSPDGERVRHAARCMKALSDAERRAAMQALEPLLGRAGGDAVDATAAAPLSLEEVQSMHRRGMCFGAHGVNHAILTRMLPQEARREVQESLAGVASLVGVEVREFAYPNGDADERVASLTAESGVRLAFTMQGRENRPGDDPLRLGRRNVCEDTSRGAGGGFSRAYFCCEITGVFDLLLRRGSRGR